MNNLARSGAVAALAAAALIGIGSPSHAAVTPDTTIDPTPGGCSVIYYTGGGSLGADITVHNCTKYAYLVDVYTVSLTHPTPHHYADVGVPAYGVKKVSISSINATSSPGKSPQYVYFTKIG